MKQWFLTFSMNLLPYATIWGPHTAGFAGFVFGHRTRMSVKVFANRQGIKKNFNTEDAQITDIKTTTNIKDRR